jgi:hypothetical protein
MEVQNIFITSPKMLFHYFSDKKLKAVSYAKRYVFKLISRSVHAMIVTFTLNSSLKWKNSVAGKNEAYKPTYIEHIANIITHGVSVYLDGQVNPQIANFAFII